MLSNIENQKKGFTDIDSLIMGNLKGVGGTWGGWHQDEMRIAEMSDFKVLFLDPESCVRNGSNHCNKHYPISAG